MSFVKPIVAIVAAGLISPVYAAYGPAHHAPKGCAAMKMSTADRLMMGNSVMSGAQSSKCWYNRFRVSGTANVAVGSATVKDFTNSTDADLKDFKLNNVNLFVDADVAKDVSAHVNVHYGDNDFFNDLYKASTDGGSGVVITGPAAYTVNTVSVDEAYVTMKNIMNMPLYVKAGQMFLDFGNYSDPYTAAPSLTQVLSQANESAVGVGYSHDSGLYGSVFAFRGNREGASAAAMNNSFSNFGGKVGYGGKFDGINYDVNVSYLNDVRSIYESGARNNPGLKRYFMDNINDSGTFAKREDLTSAHVGASYMDFDVAVDWTGIGGDLSASTTNTGGEVVGVSGKYNFELSSMASNVHARYESVSDGDNIIAYESSYNVGFTTAVNNNVDFNVDYTFYDGAQGTNGAFSGEPKEASVFLVGLKAKM
jgi:hypothetical protein